MSLEKGERGKVALTPHMEHYLLSCGLRSFTCRWKRYTTSALNRFVHTTDLKSFIRTICSKSSKIKIFNCRIKTNLARHQMCPKYSLLSPSLIRRTSASALNATTFLGDESEMSPLSPSVSLSQNPTSQSHPAGRLSYFHGGGADTEPEAGSSQSHQKSSESLSLYTDGLLNRGNKV